MAKQLSCRREATAQSHGPPVGWEGSSEIGHQGVPAEANLSRPFQIRMNDTGRQGQLDRFEAGPGHA